MGAINRRLANAEEMVFAMLAEAARAGAPCPSNQEICAAIGASSIATAARVVGTLEQRGLIDVERGHKHRIVTLCDTGERTAVPAAGVGDGARRADQLAELVAEGSNLTSAAAVMGLSRQRVEQIWQWICARLGPQAT